MKNGERIRARVRVALALWLGACGPSIGGIEGETDTNGTGASTAETMSTPEPVTGGPATPPGSPSTSGSGVGSSSAVDDASTGDDSDEPSCIFLCMFDAPSESCDLFAQNCPPGEKCMPWADDGGPAWNATRCSPLAKDTGSVGEPCMVEGSGVSGIDDCDVGLMCWNVDENGVGVCEDMCTGSAEDPICEDPEDACVIANDGAIALCMTTCHPLSRQCAIEDGACGPIADQWVCTHDWSWREGGAYGESCEFVTDCDIGNLCVMNAAFTSCDGALGCCTILCDLNDAAADAQCQALDPAQTCEPWYADGQAPLGYDDLGVCMIDPRGP